MKSGCRTSDGIDEGKQETKLCSKTKTEQPGSMGLSMTRHIIPYFFDRLVLWPHRPQRSVPTSSHERQYPSVSFWHTEHRFSELHFPSTTASTQNHTISRLGVARSSGTEFNATLTLAFTAR